MSLKPTERFSDRVHNYTRYRPGYPAEVLAVLRDECGLSASSVVADVGSGTGIWTRVLLGSGATVYAIEPNAAMRKAAEAELLGKPLFHSVDGTAEATGLEDASVDLVTAAQAFHWFDWAGAAREFRRILRGRRMVALIWNDRLTTGSAFSVGYEQLLKSYSPEYAVVNHKDVGSSEIGQFFESMQVARFVNVQSFGLDGLIGRMLSSSYVPQSGAAGHEEIMAAARRLFDSTAVSGLVEFE